MSVLLLDKVIVVTQITITNAIMMPYSTVVEPSSRPQDFFLLLINRLIPYLDVG